MTDIDAVHARLAADLADYQAYFVLADLYDEDGKPELAEGFRALGFQSTTPMIQDLRIRGGCAASWAGVWYAWGKGGSVKLRVRASRPASGHRRLVRADPPAQRITRMECRGVDLFPVA